MINWNDLTADQQRVLEMLPISFLSSERGAYDAERDTIRQLVEMRLARPALTTYKRITEGDRVLAQKPKVFDTSDLKALATEEKDAAIVKAVDAILAIANKKLDELIFENARLRKELETVYSNQEAQ